MTSEQTTKINTDVSAMAIDRGSDPADTSGKYAQDLKALTQSLNDAGIQFDDKGLGHFDAASARGKSATQTTDLDSEDAVGGNIGLSQFDNDISKYKTALAADPNSTATSTALGYLKRDVEVNQNLTAAGRNAMLTDIGALEDLKPDTNVSKTLARLKQVPTLPLVPLCPARQKHQQP